MSAPTHRPLTRNKKERSKKEWESLISIIEREFKGLEGWLSKDANPKVTDLHKNLSGNLKDVDNRWECETQLRIILTLVKTGQGKIAFIESLLGKLNDQVLGAPIAESDADIDTSKARLFKAREIESTFEDSKEAFDRWQSLGMKLRENFNKLTSVRKVKDKDTEDSEDRGSRRPRQEDKVSTTDAKSLKPDLLETSMPQLQIKNWYRTWDNYMCASGWGQGDNHQTQMAYLRTCISKEIRTAINFDNLRTVNNALFQIKDYMKSSVMPLTLQRIELLRYSLPQGQSQSAATQTIIEIFRGCDGFSITPEEVLIICLLNTIQEKSVLIKVQEQIIETSTWEQVCNLIVKIDSTSRILDNFKQTKTCFSGTAARLKACCACGKKGHMAAACTIPKDKLSCKFCNSQNSHNTAACIKKQKADKEKKQGETTERRIQIQSLKQPPKREETPQKMGENAISRQ